MMPLDGQSAAGTPAVPVVPTAVPEVVPAVVPEAVSNGRGTVGKDPAEGPAAGPAHSAGADAVGLIGKLRAVLRVRDFRRLWMSMALSSFGDWLGLLAI